MENQDNALNFRDIRKYTGLSQRGFSAAYNIPLRTIEDWESGRRKPPEYLLQLLAKDTGFLSPENTMK